MNTDTQLSNIFHSKGIEQEDWQKENLNAFEIRRVLQMIKDLNGADISNCSILDIACGDGAYSVEAVLQGVKNAQGIDARIQRMSMGQKAKEKLRLNNLLFEKADLREYLIHCPEYDTILFLGILYHLDAKSLFPVIDQLYEKTNKYLIIDTHISSDPIEEYEYEGKKYYGHNYREHFINDTEETKESRQLNSIDNITSFWLSFDSLVRALRHSGFTTVLECHSPAIPSKLKDRVTLLAIKGTPVVLNTFPWVNNYPDIEIDNFNKPIKPKKSKLRKIIDLVLNPLGVTIRRI